MATHSLENSLKGMNRDLLLGVVIHLEVYSICLGFVEKELDFSLYLSEKCTKVVKACALFLDPEKLAANARTGAWNKNFEYGPFSS